MANGHYNEDLDTALSRIKAGAAPALSRIKAGATSGNFSSPRKAGETVRASANQVANTFTWPVRAVHKNVTPSVQEFLSGLAGGSSAPAPSTPYGVLRSDQRGAGFTGSGLPDFTGLPGSTGPSNAPTQNTVPQGIRRGSQSPSNAVLNGPTKDVSRGTGIAGIRRDLTRGENYFTNLPSGQNGVVGSAQPADLGQVLNDLIMQRKYFEQANAERAGPGPRSVLIGQRKEASPLADAIKDATDRSRPRGTGRNELLKAKYAQQELAKLTSLQNAQLSADTSRANALTSADAGVLRQLLSNQGAFDRQGLANQGALDTVNARNAAAYDQMLAKLGIDKELLNFQENLPGRQADIASRNADTNYRNALTNQIPLEAEAAKYKGALEYSQQTASDRTKFLGDLIGSPAFSTLPKETQARVMQEALGYADGGLVQPVLGYADGGPVGFDSQPTMESLDPAIREYSQYVATATKHNLQPVPLGKFIDLMDAGRKTLQSYPTTGGVQGFADGGMVPVAGKQVLDPTGMHDLESTDSIPAVIDGAQPAALTSGEYVIPEAVVRAKGTEFFDKLVAQYTEQPEG